MTRSLAFEPISFTDRFSALNGIRAIAVTCVFLDHYGGGAHGGRLLNVLNEIRSRGWIGVDLFFVLSGFLITGILFDTRDDRFYFKRFFARRSLRIFPVLYLVAAILLALTPILHYQWRLGHLLFLVYVGNILANHDFSYYEILSTAHPTFKVFIGHFWSLCVEEQFYCLWPLVVWLVRDRVNLIRVATAISGISLFLRYGLVLHLGTKLAETWIVRTLPFRLDSLLIGAILALLLRGPNAARWQALCRPLFLTSGILTLAIFCFSPSYDSPWLLTIGLTLTALTSCGLIGLALRKNSMTYNIFNQRALYSLGKYSYGFYVYHMLYMWAWIQLLIALTTFFHSKAIAGVIAISTNFILTYIAAKVSYNFFEVRFLHLKRYFEYDAESVVGQLHTKAGE